MRDGKQEIAKHSKKLIAISFAIIVFVVGGGHFNQKPEYFSGLIGFDNVSVIPFTVIIVFLFYWYRFWIWKRQPLKFSKNKFYDSLKEDTKFRNYFREKSKGVIQNRIENSIPIDDKIWEDDQQGRPVRAEYDPGTHKKLGLLAKEFPSRALDSRGRGKGDVKIELDFKRYYHLIRVKLNSIIYNKEYTYQVLPFWMAVIASFCIIYAIIRNIFSI